MGGLTLRLTGPRKPSLSPQVIPEEEDPVPVFFLDETYDSAYDSAGIEDDYTPPQSPVMGSTFSELAAMPTISPMATKRKMQTLTSAMRKHTSDEPRLNKLVRFLDRVEIVPTPQYDYDLPCSSVIPYDSHDIPSASNKKQKLTDTDDLDLDFIDSTFYQAIVTPATPDTEIDGVDFDIGIASGLGRAGSPNRSPSRSPNRSPNGSTRDLTSTSPPSDTSRLSPTVPRLEISAPPSPPPSWRIPPESLTGRQPHVEEPPRVRSPSNEDEEVDLRVDEYFHGRPQRSTRSASSTTRPDSGVYLDDTSPTTSSIPATESSNEQYIRPGVSYIPAKPTPTLKRKPKFHPPPIHPVIARKMWPHGEVRFEDQWGRRLIPAEKRDSFRFDLWPVEEDVALEERVAVDIRKGGWVKGREGRARRSSK